MVNIGKYIIFCPASEVLRNLIRSLVLAVGLNSAKLLDISSKNDDTNSTKSG